MSKTRIMIVEDEGIVALSIQKKLENLGYEVPAIIADGEEAIEQAAKVRPHLTLMDIMLAGEMDGIEAAGRIGERFNIPVIYLTANSDEQTLQRAKITEPFGYLLKPFEERELHTTIEMALYKHQMETKLRESESWLATTLRSIGDAVIATDGQGQIKFMNPVAEAITGWSQTEALGQELGQVFNIINEQTRLPIAEPVTKILQESVITGLADHTALISKQGIEVPVEDSVAPIRDDAGNITGIVLVFHDVTERKKAQKALQKSKDELEIKVAKRTVDLQKANQQLQFELAERTRAEIALAKQAQELARSNAELEQFAYVASHDLREPLRKIKSFTELLEQRYKGQLDEKADKYIHYIVDGAARMQMLVTDLLTYSRTGRGELGLEITDLNDVLHQVKEDLEVAIEDSQATISYDPLPTLRVEAQQIAQLLQNLIGNALKFRGDAPLRVHVSAQQQDNEWRFAVRDNGIGLEPQYAGRIFQIFQRLHAKGEYSGTGIGLAICKKIVERHGGRIWVKSELNQGATFYFTLPAD